MIETGKTFTMWAVDVERGGRWVDTGLCNLRATAAEQVEMVMRDGGIARVREVMLPQLGGCTESEARARWQHLSAEALRAEVQS